MTLPRENDLGLFEEAAEWAERVQEDDTPACHADFIAWLKRSPRHMDEFLLAAATLQELQGVDPSRRINVTELMSGPPANVVHLQSRDRTEAFDATLEGIPPRGLVPRTDTRRYRTTYWGFGIAVVLAVVLSLGGWVFSHRPGASRIYETGVGEQRAFKLDDGSVIHLNTRSRVEVHFTAPSRDVRLLQGEALFAVEHNPARPFRVITRTAIVQAVGTQFDVYESPERTAVSVVEGRVQIAAIGPETAPQQEHIDSIPMPAYLGMGEQANVESDGRIVKRTTPDVTRAVAWRQRRLVFRGDTLATVVEQFNRYNSSQMSIEDSAIAQRRITAVFEADKPEALIKFLQQDTGVAIERTDREFIIRRKPGD